MGVAPATRSGVFRPRLHIVTFGEVSANTRSSLQEDDPGCELMLVRADLGVLSYDNTSSSPSSVSLAAASRDRGFLSATPMNRFEISNPNFSPDDDNEDMDPCMHHMMNLHYHCSMLTYNVSLVPRQQHITLAISRG
eukprot:6184459-Pleurochrysis_carterae.AAC.1